MEHSIFWKPGFIPVYLVAILGLVLLFHAIHAPLLVMTPVIVLLAGEAIASIVVNARRRARD